jgi:hypothetical protein
MIPYINNTAIKDRVVPGSEAELIQNTETIFEETFPEIKDIWSLCAGWGKKNSTAMGGPGKDQGNPHLRLPMAMINAH